ncbi:hypothetical protein [Mesomycoplasma lagogenitalium]|uniref:Uncharacterized protein n=1 Tax=Mesomycoplasma lagogenitalium TaxID=171286 RepID=A0ABY8LT85_9BACT|nr:hypothetical protein [Mesomycoplasma lagogenitalium]WGI36467.1 hypothetical protein QEG99_03310 [Mesomycoplasma lagogenitalium]
MEIKFQIFYDEKLEKYTLASFNKHGSRNSRGVMLFELNKEIEQQIEKNKGKALGGGAIFGTAGLSIKRANEIIKGYKGDE